MLGVELKAIRRFIIMAFNKNMRIVKFNTYFECTCRVITKRFHISEAATLVLATKKIKNSYKRHLVQHDFKLDKAFYLSQQLS